MGQALTQALQIYTGSSAGTFAGELAAIHYPEIAANSGSSWSGLPNTLAALIGETVLVGGTYKALATCESAGAALAQTEHLYELTQV